jgi:YidC/Oxa1 family membrane protein insertase
MEEEKSGGSGLSRWLLIAVAGLLFYQFGLPLLTGKKPGEDRQPSGINNHLVAPGDRAPVQLCTIQGDRFTAKISTRDAALRNFVLGDKKYASDGKPLDLVTAGLNDEHLPLRTDLRPSTLLDPKAGVPSENLVVANDPKQQLAYDNFDWKLEAQDSKSCTFTYQDATTKLTKVFAATGGPFELGMTLTVENLADTPKKHRLAIEQSAWRTRKEIAGGFMQRQSEFATELVTATTEKTERHGSSDYEPSDFKKKEFDDEKWRQSPGTAKYAAVSSSYFAQVVAAGESPKPPRVETMAEEHWDEGRYKNKTDDPLYGHVYTARLTYPEIELQPKGTATYKVVSFAGPKEREVLTAVAQDISGVLNLGTFSFIGKGLVWYLYRLEAITRSWGWAIVLLTITVRLLVFPLSLAQIKHTIAMRKLKPEMDAINKRYKDDMTQRGVATQELFRRHGMSQFSFATGCLPMVLQLPVWWALYTALQTAVELYHTPFLWFTDLSAPDQLFHIGSTAFGPIPFVLGATSFLQQKMMPAQGTDPQQQKMMMYMMPGIFTLMMLFLPSGLGVYMLTSSIVSIGQQFAVERYLKRRAESGGSGGGSIIVKVKGDGDDPPALGKGKARVRG